MPDEWYVERKTRISGPYTGTKLKALATEGRVSPSDLIRKGADGKPVAASDVAGLFTPTRGTPKVSQTPPRVPPSQRTSEGDLADLKWHYANDGTRSGPSTSKELKTLADIGLLRPSDLVWREDMTDWKEARSVKGLFPNPQPSGPPPLSGRPRPSASTFAFCRLSVGLWTTIAGVGGFFVVLVVAIMSFDPSNPSTAADRPPIAFAQAPLPNAPPQIGIPNGLPQAGVPNVAADKPKLAALQKVIAKYHTMPDPLDGTKAHEQFNRELQALQDDFIKMPFDPIKDREQAKAIVNLYEAEIEHRYDGLLKNKLDQYIREIGMEMRSE
jgi:hypothetical protein